MPGLRELFTLADDDRRLQAYRRKKWQRSAEFCGWLQQDALAALNMVQAVDLYRASGGRDTARFETNPIEEIRDGVDFLLYDNIKLEGRFDECAAPPMPEQSRTIRRLERKRGTVAETGGPASRQHEAWADRHPLSGYAGSTESSTGTLGPARF